jgi:hypothetical protein
MPPTPKADELDLAMPEEENLSRQAQFSSYAPDPEAEEQNPPSGPQTVQELGPPTEATPKRAAAPKEA